MSSDLQNQFKKMWAELQQMKAEFETDLKKAKLDEERAVDARQQAEANFAKAIEMETILSGMGKLIEVKPDDEPNLTAPTEIPAAGRALNIHAPTREIAARQALSNLGGRAKLADMVDWLLARGYGKDVDRHQLSDTLHMAMRRKRGMFRKTGAGEWELISWSGKE